MDEHTSHELAYKKGYEKGKQDAMKWIPVTERLPEPLMDVIAYDSTANWVTFCYMSYQREWVGVRMNNKVTHWMPLPEPPKGE